MNRPEEEPKTRHLPANGGTSEDVDFSADDLTIDHAPSQPDGQPDETIVSAGMTDKIARLGRDTKLPKIPGYEVLEILGRGGMGVVYKARDLKLKRLVAIKMILAGEHAGESDLARFRAEAEAVARLQHPNFVQIYEVGEHNNHQFLVLELVTGGSLADYIDRTSLSTRQAAELVEALARAVHYAHERGVIHRDLKPGNILLAISESNSDPDRTKELSVGSTWNSGASSVSKYGTTSGMVPKVTDFGLAKQLDANTEHTRTGAVIGTPNYMAPEQAAGHARTSGPAVDTYTLGAILYVLLTGRPPFHAETQVETLVLVRQSEPVPPTRIQKRLPRDLETICLKCLEKLPAKRYASAVDLADDSAARMEDRCQPLSPSSLNGPIPAHSYSPHQSGATEA